VLQGVFRVLQCVAVSRSVLQCVAGVAVRAVMQCVAVCCNMMQFVAVCCSVLQCVAVCCNYLAFGCVYPHQVIRHTYSSRTVQNQIYIETIPTLA